uniref:Uncharacterized protein n=1 Tax=Rhizophora mucronata TaxID=61149 RepID=A0A2P2PNF8_RHIMU
MSPPPPPPPSFTINNLVELNEF